MDVTEFTVIFLHNRVDFVLYVSEFVVVNMTYSFDSYRCNIPR